MFEFHAFGVCIFFQTPKAIIDWTNIDFWQDYWKYIATCSRDFCLFNHTTVVTSTDKFLFILFYNLLRVHKKISGEYK